MVVQYKLPKRVDDMVQRFGRAGQDQSISATAILLVEKKFCSNGAIEIFDALYAPKPRPIIPAKRRMQLDPDSPSKRWADTTNRITNHPFTTENRPVTPHKHRADEDNSPSQHYVMEESGNLKEDPNANHTAQPPLNLFPLVLEEGEDGDEEVRWTQDSSEFLMGCSHDNPFDPEGAVKLLDQN